MDYIRFMLKKKDKMRNMFNYQVTIIFMYLTSLVKLLNHGVRKMIVNISINLKILKLKFLIPPNSIRNGNMMVWLKHNKKNT
jgi:hypothetical protein